MDRACSLYSLPERNGRDFTSYLLEKNNPQQIWMHQTAVQKNWESSHNTTGRVRSESTNVPESSSIQPPFTCPTTSQKWDEANNQLQFLQCCQQIQWMKASESCARVFTPTFSGVRDPQTLQEIKEKSTKKK